MHLHAVELDGHNVTPSACGELSAALEIFYPVAGLEVQSGQNGSALVPHPVLFVHEFDGALQLVVAQFLRPLAELGQPTLITHPGKLTGPQPSEPFL